MPCQIPDYWTCHPDCLCCCNGRLLLPVLCNPDRVTDVHSGCWGAGRQLPACAGMARPRASCRLAVKELSHASTGNRGRHAVGAATAACLKTILKIDGIALRRAVQVVYILDQVRALEREMLKRIAAQGLSIVPQILVVTRLIPDAEAGPPSACSPGITHAHVPLPACMPDPCRCDSADGTHCNKPQGGWTFCCPRSTRCDQL